METGFTRFEGGTMPFSDVPYPNDGPESNR